MSISKRSCCRSRSSARGHQRTAIRRRRALGRFREPQPPGPLDPERYSYRRELAWRLEAALDSIPLKLRLAFIVCEIEGLTAVQAAAVAGIPAATVRTRLFHARRQLRDLLALEHDE
jgi:RNA polymerase sigma-70 factor, ECF subfamily